MSDRSLRELERRWQLSQDPADLARLQEARLRAGVVARERLELAALLGDAGARAVTGPAPADPPWNAWARVLEPGAARAFLLFAREELREELPRPPRVAAQLQALLGGAPGARLRAEDLFPALDARASRRILRELGHPPEDVELSFQDGHELEAAWAEALDAAPAAALALTSRLVQRLQATHRVGGLFTRGALDMARAAERLLRGSRGEFMALRDTATGPYPSAREALLAWARGE